MCVAVCITLVRADSTSNTTTRWPACVAVRVAVCVAVYVCVADCVAVRVQ